MNSVAGAAGALAVLLAIPMAIVSQIVGVSASVSVHLFLGLGTLLVGWSARHLVSTRWLAWVGFGVATGLGQWLEGVLGLLLVGWFFAPLHPASRGRTRVLGWIVLPLLVASGWYLLASIQPRPEPV